MNPRREPLAVALVLLNLGLGGAILYRYLNRRAPMSLPPGHPDVSVPADLAANAAPLALSGVVRLSPELNEPWPKGAFVFVIARAQGGGPPYAVRRYENVTPPFAFQLGPDNLMIAGLPAPKSLVISARVDQDGDAMTRQLGDLESAPTEPVAPQAAVEVVIDRPATLVKP